LHAAFIPFGEIVELQLLVDDAGGMVHCSDVFMVAKNRRYGFVEYEFAEDAQAAIDNMNLSEMFGKTIKVSLSHQTQSGGAPAMKPSTHADGCAMTRRSSLGRGGLSAKICLGQCRRRTARGTEYHHRCIPANARDSQRKPTRIF
jgi:RNA recognition motif-containing protein